MPFWPPPLRPPERRFAATLRRGGKHRWRPKLPEPPGVRNRIQKLLHQRPFQSWRDIEYAFQLLSVRSFGQKVIKSYEISKVDTIKEQLNGIVHRRNQIVHEGDLVRHARGGRVRKHQLSGQYVEDSLDFLEGLVDCLETIP